eukprot:m.48076 g.48076  ORF g.48076 m.48076 type:complete len:104 (-) comp11008_c1_seq2:1552-1863(-)
MSLCILHDCWEHDAISSHSNSSKYIWTGWKEQVVRGKLIPKRFILPIAPTTPMDRGQVLRTNVMRIQDEPPNSAQLRVPINTEDGVCEIVSTNHNWCANLIKV